MFVIVVSDCKLRDGRQEAMVLMRGTSDSIFHQCTSNTKDPFGFSNRLVKQLL